MPEMAHGGWDVYAGTNGQWDFSHPILYRFWRRISPLLTGHHTLWLQARQEAYLRRNHRHKSRRHFANLSRLMPVLARRTLRPLQRMSRIDLSDLPRALRDRQASNRHHPLVRRGNTVTCKRPPRLPDNLAICRHRQRGSRLTHNSPPQVTIQLLAPAYHLPLHLQIFDHLLKWRIMMIT